MPRRLSLVPLLSATLSMLLGDPGPPTTDHPVRRRLLELIRKRPGLRLSTLWKTTDVNRGTAQYHLLMLERAQFVESRREGKNLTRYYPAGIDPRELVLLSLLRRGRVLEVVREIQNHPGITQQQLTKRLFISRKVFRTYADLLLHQDLLKEIRESNVKRYFPTPYLEVTLDRLDESWPDGLFPTEGPR